MTIEEAREITKQHKLLSGDKFMYMMLDRMRSDCDYYLGNGNRCAKHLWVPYNEEEHIRVMLSIYKQLPEKPEWLTEEQIMDYADKMGVKL